MTDTVIDNPTIPTDGASTVGLITRDVIIKSTWSHYVIIGASIFAIIWGYFNVIRVSAFFSQLLECLTVMTIG